MSYKSQSGCKQHSPIYFDTTEIIDTERYLPGPVLKSFLQSGTTRASFISSGDL